MQPSIPGAASFDRDAKAPAASVWRWCRARVAARPPRDGLVQLMVSRSWAGWPRTRGWRFHPAASYA